MLFTPEMKNQALLSSALRRGGSAWLICYYSDLHSYYFFPFKYRSFEKPIESFPLLLSMPYLGDTWQEAILCCGYQDINRCNPLGM